MSVHRDSVIDAGVDYLTATYVGRHGDSSLADFGRFLVEQEVGRGEELRPFRFSGYNGLHAGSASYGRRHDGELVRISSALAKEHWNQCVSLSTNITRIDVQVTVLPSEGPQRRLLKHHKQIRRGSRGRGRPAKFKFWYGPSGPEAAILGSRASERFGRIYDKGIESRLKRYEGALRYEVELKGSAAVNLASQLDTACSTSHLIAAVVHKFVSIRGCQCLPWIQTPLRPGSSASLCDNREHENFKNEQESVFASPAGNRDIGEGRAFRRASWLYNCVRPSVQEFIDRGQSEVVLQALGLCGSVEKVPMDQRDTWSIFNKWR